MTSLYVTTQNAWMHYGSCKDVDHNDWAKLASTFDQDESKRTKVNLSTAQKRYDARRE